VTVNDGVAAPKIIDFGIAKATSGQVLTDKPSTRLSNNSLARRPT